jgi:hypothetical protein
MFPEAFGVILKALLVFAEGLSGISFQLSAFSQRLLRDWSG